MTHTPVLLKEMLFQLAPHSGGIYVDATFGAGGYSKAILESADCKVYAIDRDETVTKFYDDLNVKYPDRINLFIEKFSNIKNLLDSNNIKGINGIVFDVGVSSMQLDNGDRGFSFLRDGLLNMSMDNYSHVNASTFVNALREEEIANTIYNYGGERHSRKIARAIVNARKKKIIKTTFELADIVRSVVFRGKSKIDPATRTFQAIRIWVNDELGELEKGIKAASEILSENGKLIVVTFHSLEDRIVKTLFKDLCEPGPTKTFSLLNKKVMKASAEEINANPRARSAKLRAIQRLS
ncbi:16S rRNA (cytosine(1402)-N(4))-methyltransferase RsmH [Wolbachia endosymbiont of Diaphorina citri]|jgi:S-adenosyl-methyltransferase MraW|uniref:16S rRNA (cytosine(1402)-N(4))-methyltransferase RsmH n=1 Tax=Wolbachia endosymbiont of Diaphorina citri TaxID=116598 RepID=UPI0002F4F4C6|nr:16S rRNA (cytosine(1402)-N(4))-methyltransferase RsmH [Wolbachia endosymbiont of Diaphorina citri]QJT94453.1 16S rRNA (cytosine(1402)-N(4))-methyltransferase RsmH [Wolbachia endosymbiont of Diaphorina citri]QJT95694.1 16S rRNA (cytosine(1402)-N(4))-methyltransferase RsmH [Wolbachia endosymbiont of Diaphorina citri]QJT97056.1 16S rRNA (cytosine(1402)-N(4))-methyltransferase RsmH [Wolbachia endosymbiont of Diaphorina citri]QLK11352.1 16S rRNA (cytosine(1402)-N(4))-methyltransferase RsmH [Wolba